MLRNVHRLRAGIINIAWRYATVLPAAAGSVLVVAVHASEGSHVAEMKTGVLNSDSCLDEY